MSNTIHNLNIEELNHIITLLSQNAENLNTLIAKYRRKALEITEFDMWDTSARELLNDQITQTAQRLEVASSLMVSLGNAFEYYKEQLENLTNDNIKDMARIDGGIK